jgi:hypothetical protein
VAELMCIVLQEHANHGSRTSWLALLHLDGATVEWYYSLEHEYGMLPWTHFAEFVNLCFGPPIQFNPLGELKAL